jgi:diguanylate cyclase
LETLSDFSEFSDFNEAADHVMASLRIALGLEYWLVTRLAGDDWVVLRTSGTGPFVAGESLKLSSTICSHMIAGRGPNIAHDVTKVTSYAAAAIREAHTIESYAGAPIVIGGNVYGVLCALDSQKRSEDLLAHAHLLATSARMLSTLLATQIEAESLVRRAERAEAEALIDELTGLYNRRGWERLLANEAQRSQRYGNQATLFLMDIDGLKETNDTLGHAAGDDLIKRTGAAISSITRENDISARLGGDEFGLLAIETNALDAQVLNDRLDAAFDAAAVRVSIGRAHCNRNGGILSAVAFADEAMYWHKAHRARRSAATPS